MISEIYNKYFNIFNKVEFNKLSLYRFKMDYKIEVKGNINDLSYNLLYKIFISKLKAYKKYLINNLRKGFIKSSFTL